MIVTKPPMGWNTWNTFGANINEQLILESAEKMVTEGLKDVGYQYVVIDDCWAKKQRNEKGELEADSEKFPHGMKYLADKIHALGLKFGMYSCCGTKTCAGYPSSFEYEYIDAATFASWGVDFLKYDHCYKPCTELSDFLYRRMGLALANCGRDILYSACSWGVNGTPEWIKSTGAQMWRSTGDIMDSWESIKDLYEKNIPLQGSNGFGCFNDMDMLVVGMHGKGNAALTGCTTEEYRTHFSLWAMLNSPLMIGCDIRNMSPEDKAILSNPEVIAINQEGCSHQPWLSSMNSWVKFLEGGDLAVCMANLTEKETYGNLILSDIGLGHATGLSLSVRDVWSHEELGVFHTDLYVPSIAPHSCRMFRCKVVHAL